ncbi:hypothetical protein [Vibrio sp. YQ_11]|uniref:hypothetical protein n=1 Tax=unclassified Vibrio TaxID=2614977 RepID=UPI00370CAFEC
MIKDYDVVRVTNIDYDGRFRVESARNLTVLPGDTEFSLVAVVYPLDRRSFVSYVREQHGYKGVIDELVVQAKHLEVVNEQDI